MARAPIRAWGGRRAQELVAETLALYGTTCHLCGQPGADSADHEPPRSKGGRNVLEDLRPAHRACNVARQDRDLADWFAAHPLPHRAPLPPSRAW